MIKASLLLVAIAFISAAFAAALDDPVADPKAIVLAGNARFTILTSRLIRMEYSASKTFQDAATWAFQNRRLPVPQFSVSHNGPWIMIDTDATQLEYLTTSTTSFNATNLRVTVNFNQQSAVWVPAHYADDPGNLLGTVRTLDSVNGAVNLQCINQSNAGLHCTYGLISQTGFSVVDDTHQPYFVRNPDGSKWPWLADVTYSVPDPTSPVCASIDPSDRRDCGFPGITSEQCESRGCCNQMSEENGVPQCWYSSEMDQDLYIFGYGHDYKAALKDFTLVSGPIPIPPRYAFGVFYSRYWAYSDNGQMDIVSQYEERDIPLDILVTDMDWHITFYKEANAGVKDQAGQNIGWTGFTWDSHLFPNPQGFLDWCKARGLKNTLNLHPASGMQPWEDKYVAMANAMGIDPTTKKYVPFNITDTKFTNNWLQLVLEPLAQQGIDFWWLDWQQGEDWIDQPSVNPTFWLNYVFFTDPNHWGSGERQMLLHRWGGLGNHRYQIGFSGDVVPSWESLAFQPYFTATAANVGYGYWSHDIGGHTMPAPSPELYTRWIQWGIFSPAFRTHCTKNVQNDRRIWLYPNDNYVIMRVAMKLRAAMIPYIYSNAYRAFDTGLSLLTPMYYEYPENKESYTFTNQYFFGDQMLVSPVVSPMDITTLLSSNTVWLPDSSIVWVDWFAGKTYKGDTTINGLFTLDEIPVYVRAGSVIPLKLDSTPAIGQAQNIPTGLKLAVFPGALTGKSRLYEDDGSTSQYLEGAYAFTEFDLTVSPNAVRLDIQPVDGQYEGMPNKRTYQINFISQWPASAVTLNGVAIPYDASETPSANAWRYDGMTLTLIVNIVTEIPTNVVNTIQAQLIGPSTDPILTSGFPRLVKRFLNAKEVLDNQWGIDTVYDEDYYDLITASETGRRITYNPQTAVSELSAFVNTAASGVAQLKSLTSLQAAVKEQLVAQLTDSLSMMLS